MSKSVRSPFSRLWTIEDGAGPANVPTYQGQARAQGPSWAFGDRTPIREPDPNRYGAFRIADAMKGDRGLPALPIEARYPYTISQFLALARRGCPFDLQVHIGDCQDPRDFNKGWLKILHLSSGDISNWAASEMGAFDGGQDAVVNETIAVNGFDMYEIARLSLAELGTTQIVQLVLDVVICDSVSCGECGLPSSGCDRFFAIQTPSGVSPGLPPEIVWSQDGGTTLAEITVTTMTPSEVPAAMACVGPYLVVISQGGLAIHYTLISDIVAGTQTWSKVVTGLVAAKGPNAMYSAGGSQTWIVGQGGYIYFAEDITQEVLVQSAGTATVQNLTVVHGSDDQNIIAAGAANALVVTRNGGDSWTLVTMPTAQAAIAITAVWMLSVNEWLVGYTNGKLYFTRNGGVSWTEKNFPGSGSGIVRDLVFATDAVGYMAHSTAAVAGRILRTIDGGRSWYVLPEGAGAIPANDAVVALAASGECPNVVYGGGIADNATDGFLVKGTA